METFGLLTEGGKGFGWFAGLGHTDGIDCKDPHFIWHSFNHLLGFECSFFDQVKVQSHPSGALLLFSLDEVAFRGWSETCHLTTNTYVLAALISKMQCLPNNGEPPSYFGGSHVIEHQSPPTSGTKGASGGSGMSADNTRPC